MPVINFRDVTPLSGFEPLPNGAYEVEIAACKLGLTAESKDAMLSFEYNVTENNAGFARRKIFENLVFGEKSAEISTRRLKSIMLASGFEENDIPEVDVDDDFANSMIGYTLVVTVTQKPGKGKYADQMQNQVVSYAKTE